MKQILSILILICFISIQINCNTLNSETVQIWTRETWTQQYDQNKPVLLLLYADWCSHCHDLMPTWNKLQNQLGHIAIAAIECDAAGDFCGQFTTGNMISYPMLRYIDEDKTVYVHEGRRTENDLVGFVYAGHLHGVDTFKFPENLQKELNESQGEKKQEDL